jgi:hypothetical protein
LLTPNPVSRVGLAGGGGNHAAGAAGTKECIVLRAIASLILASATAHSASALLPNSPWWERITVTISGDGEAQGCRFESSLRPNAPQSCDVAENDQAAVAKATNSSGSKDQYTRITFERRFTPGPRPKTQLQTGDTLLGSQVLALAIDGRGQVKNCKVVAETGSMKPDYGCDEASGERFEASAGAHRATTQEAYMSVIVYGHQEHAV